MTALVQELLNAFDRLTDAERSVLVLEILKRTIYLDFPLLSDSKLLSGIFTAKNPHWHARFRDCRDPLRGLR